MRFIISELPYERPVARGKWRYEQAGQPTGAIETWRLSATGEGFYFLRIDLDARAAPSGRSYIYHLVLDEEMKPVRLKYRFWRANRERMGNVQLEAESALVTSGQGANRAERQVALQEGYCFWFPSTVALGLLATADFLGPRQALHLAVTGDQDAEATLAPQVTTLQRGILAGAAGRVAAEKRIELRWEDQRRTIDIGDHGWPLRMSRQDDLSAREIQLLQYGRTGQPGAWRDSRRANRKKINPVGSRGT